MSEQVDVVVLGMRPGGEEVAGQLTHGCRSTPCGT